MASLAKIDEVRDRWTWAELVEAHVLLDLRELAEQRELDRARGR
jgi:hypothetical protein